MPHHTSLITLLCVGFVLAFAPGLLAQRLKLSPLVRYLLAGVLAGPFANPLLFALLDRYFARSQTITAGADKVMATPPYRSLR